MRAVKEVNRGRGGGDGDHPALLDPNCPRGCAELRLPSRPSCFPRLVNFYAAYMEQSRVSVLRAFLKKKKKKNRFSSVCVKSEGARDSPASTDCLSSIHFLSSFSIFKFFLKNGAK